MITVECYSGYRVNERPITFTLSECDYTRSFRVREVLDRWFGETADYFKVEADDDNIYLLKYDGLCVSREEVPFEGAASHNIFGLKEGTDPSRGTFILGAHYDAVEGSVVR